MMKCCQSIFHSSCVANLIANGTNCPSCEQPTRAREPPSQQQQQPQRRQQRQTTDPVELNRKANKIVLESRQNGDWNLQQRQNDFQQISRLYR